MSQPIRVTGRARTDLGNTRNYIGGLLLVLDSFKEALSIREAEGKPSNRRRSKSWRAISTITWPLEGISILK